MGEDHAMATHGIGAQLSNREFFIKRWQQEHSAFANVIAALPIDLLDFRPHPLSRSAAELVALLISAQRSCIQLCENKKELLHRDALARAHHLG